MNEYLTARYGDPCRGCGYDWSVGVDVADAGQRMLRALDGATGTERLDGLAWNVSAYAAHSADNTRIWAERVAGVALGATSPIVSYDEDALAAARGYDGLAIAGVRWSLERSLADWAAAMALAGSDLALPHPEQGPMPLEVVVRVVGHELHHHAWDIERIRGRA